MPDPPQYSPDGRFWWDGTKWNSVTSLPSHRRQRSLAATVISRFLTFLFLLLLVAGGIGAVTWFSDSGTVSTGGAYLTMQGWGSNEVCSGIVGGKLNKVAEVLHVISFGTVPDATETTSASGEILSSSCDGDIQYSIREGGIFNIFGHLWCHEMPKTQPFSNITQALGIP